MQESCQVFKVGDRVTTVAKCPYNKLSGIIISEVLGRRIKSYLVLLDIKKDGYRTLSFYSEELKLEFDIDALYE